ncbi:MAG: hypothetical protein AAGC85_05785 [Bacteroidota bacterium]
MRNYLSNFIRLGYLLLFVLELGLISFWRKHEWVGENNPVYLFVISMLIGVLPFLHLRKNQIPFTKDPPYVGIILMLLTAGLMCLRIPDLKIIFETYPIEVAQSDIIPQIDVMLRRFFVEGVTPYQKITEFGYEMFSPYMPLHWGPFIITDSLGVDHRWLPFVLYTFVSVLLAYRISQLHIHFIWKVICASLPALLYGNMMFYMDTIFGHTIEPLIMAYYMFLCLSLSSKSVVVRAIGLMFCLLSRYSVVFWVPLWLWVIWKKEGLKPAIWIAALAGVGVLILYVVPFLLPDPTIISQGLAHHQLVTNTAWTFEGWYHASGKPLILTWGTGLGIYFFDHWPGEVMDRLTAIQRTQLIVSILAVLALALVFIRGKWKMSTPLFLMLSLKLYLSIFYYLNALPFVYYIMVPVSLSMVLLPFLMEHEQGVPQTS